jgi:hypothetical protein
VSDGRPDTWCPIGILRLKASFRFSSFRHSFSNVGIGRPVRRQLGKDEPVENTGHDAEVDNQPAAPHEGEHYRFSGHTLPQPG